MENKILNIDDGLLRLDINGNGLLIFNPTDFNLYDRFMQLHKDLPAIEKKYIDEIESMEDGSDEDLELTGKAMAKAHEMDKALKARLSEVFGLQNDFDKLLGGVNLMAFGGNGQRVVTNLLEALTPYIEEGVNRHLSDDVAQAKANRQQRRAAQRGGK